MDNQIIGTRQRSALRDMNWVVHILTRQFIGEPCAQQALCCNHNWWLPLAAHPLTIIVPVLLCTQVQGPLYVDS